MQQINKVLEYGASAIHEAVGAEKHRLNVPQYLGSDDVIGIENQLFEILDNSIDECLEYRYRLREAVKDAVKIPTISIYFEITANDEVIIKDQGRGIPVIKHPTTNQPTIFRIYESDSAGGKGNLAQGGYKSATAGMHGAGAAVSKSCTSKFTVTTATLGENGIGGGIYQVTYNKGERDTSLGENGLVYVGPLVPFQDGVFKQLGLMVTGTEIRYKYDDSLFSLTYNGQPREAYDKESILERIRYILLGVDDREAIQIIFKFKDDEAQVLMPMNYTPEIFLNVTDRSNFLALPKIVSSLDTTDPAWFECMVYIYKSNTGIRYETKTVANRLSLDMAHSNEMVQSCLRDLYNENLLIKLKLEQEEYRPNARSLKKMIVSKLLDQHKVLIVMNLSSPKFDGQTKKNLKSTEYINEMRALINSRLKSCIKTFFYKFIAEAQNELDMRIEGLLYTEKKRKRELEKKQASLSLTQTINEAVSVAQDPLKRLKHHMELYDSDTRTMLSLKETIFPINESWLVLVEGASAAGALGQVDDLPITVVGLQGKIANVSGNDNVAVTKDQIKSLATQFAMGYKAICIMTDADSDGMHIRILLLAAIMKFIPNYISNGRVFIINSPNARMLNNTDRTLYAQVYNRTFSYPAKTQILTKTPAETERLLELYGPNGTAEKNAVILFEKYGGLADSTTDKETNISLVDLLQDPDYRSQLAIPTSEEIDILNDILATDSTLKKAFADEICTDNMRYIKKYSGVNERIKLPSLNLFSQAFAPEPEIEDYESFSIKYVSYQDMND